jgi:hypothetical protein
MAVAIEVHGLKETLNELRKYEPELYKAIVNEFRTGTSPLLKAVGLQYPERPLKNWHQTAERVGKARMPPYTREKAQRGLRTVVSNNRRNQGVVRIEQKDAGGQVFDTAGSRSMSRFVKNLDKRNPTKSKPPKKRSRYLYTAVEANLHIVEDQLGDAIAKTDKLIQARIVGG